MVNVGGPRSDWLVSPQNRTHGGDGGAGGRARAAAHLRNRGVPRPFVAGRATTSRLSATGSGTGKDEAGATDILPMAPASLMFLLGRLMVGRQLERGEESGITPDIHLKRDATQSGPSDAS